MYRGLIKWYNKDKGFGFIVVKDSADVFFHATKQGIDCNDLMPNMEVEFDLLRNTKGIQATNIKVIS